MNLCEAATKAESDWRLTGRASCFICANLKTHPKIANAAHCALTGGRLNDKGGLAIILNLCARKAARCPSFHCMAEMGEAL